jgi:hypothetical protein
VQREGRDRTTVEYVEKGVSGAKVRRSALDELLRDASASAVRCPRLLGASTASAET